MINDRRLAVIIFKKIFKQFNYLYLIYNAYTDAVKRRGNKTFSLNILNVLLSFTIYFLAKVLRLQLKLYPYYGLSKSKTSLKHDYKRLFRHQQP